MTAILSPEKLSYIGYLDAKRTVDARSLNSRVWNSFISRLNNIRRTDPLHVLELGGGTGNTLINVLEACSHSDLHYTIVDIDASHLARLESKLKVWGSKNKFDLLLQEDGSILLFSNNLKRSILMVCEDIRGFLRDPARKGGYGGLIGQAILDLFDLQNITPLLFGAVKEGGLLYFPINFDGVSTFLPEIDQRLDALIEEIYHNSMDARGENSDIRRSHTGRHLLSMLLSNGMKIIEAGSSDWVVLPDSTGAYIEQEHYFLRYILHCFEKELLKSTRIDNESVFRWIDTRKRQIDNGILIYIAHQLDVLAIRPQGET